MEGMLLLSGATGLLVGLGLLESRTHRRHLARIPIRIHVNGTRGKSSVTRLIAAGLRAGGMRVCAKTTGTLPRLILPDGSEEAIVRRGRVNIIEQVSVARRVAGLNVDALVVECMAVNPLLQAVCERQIVRSTHGVLTNVRPDHLDQMGPTAADVARSLCGTVPIGGRMYTTEDEHLNIVRHAARDRRSELIEIDCEGDLAVSAGELKGFSHLEHPENIALAVRICQDFGISRATAIIGMHQARPDAGATTINNLQVGNSTLCFVNAFAANDPQSTESIWNRAVGMTPRADVRTAVVN
jgi:poly-gamma-glutamate synthase PgsB/CapB